MSHRDPKRPFGPEPEDGAPEPLGRPRRARAGDAARPARPAPEPPAFAPSTDFPWLKDDTGAKGRLDDRSRIPPTGDRPQPTPAAGSSPRERAAEAARLDPRSGTAPRAAAPLAAPADDPTDPAAWQDVTEAWAADTGQGWEDAAEVKPTPATPPRRTRAAAAGRSRARARPVVGLPAVRLPGLVTGSNLAADRTALALLAADLISLAAMAIVLGTQLSGLAPTLALHLDAAGQPDRWGPPRVLWRLPLLAGMTTLLNLVLAWYVSRFDRFAGHFLLAAALVVHLIAWVAVFDFISI